MLGFSFPLLSPCATFGSAQCRLRLGKGRKSLLFLPFSLALRDLCNMTHSEDTICALATAPGGALGIVRVSGPRAVESVAPLFHARSSRPLGTTEAGRATFGEIRDDDGTLVDEVIVTLYRAPHSYTGEDSVEISCHGSTYILQTVLRLLTAHGCRLAHPGEYTQRAFLNGKMDLSQAESVADLIAARSAATHRMAINQMRGGYSDELRRLRERLLHLTSLLELELDFSDHEDLQFADRSELQRLTAEIDAKITRLTASFRLGNALKRGIPVSIVGQTNAGKSTLLNALLDEKRAIVSSVSGTTRDAIEATKTLGGVTFRFIDTAGIRHTDDEVESIGIRLAFQKTEQADIVLWLIDAGCAAGQYDSLAPRLLPLCHDKQLLVLLNKADTLDATALDDALATLGARLARDGASARDGAPAPVVLPLSAKTRTGLDALETALTHCIDLDALRHDEPVIANERHYEALNAALGAIRRVARGLHGRQSADLLSEDLRECIHHLSEIVGEIHSDAILENIFKHFCIGK